MKKLDSRGFTAIEIVLVAALVVVIGVAGFYAIRNMQDNKVASSPTPTPSAKVTYFVVKEYGVKFVLPSDLSDLTYTYSDIGKTVNFSSKGLEARADFSCKGAQGPVGIFYKGNTTTVGPDQSIQQGTNTKVIAGVYYDVEPTQVPCFTTQASTELQNTLIKSLATAIKSSLVAQ